jgi:hypothetical protein
VGIESGAADIGFVDDVLHRDGLITFADKSATSERREAPFAYVPRGDP